MSKIRDLNEKISNSKNAPTFRETLNSGYTPRPQTESGTVSDLDSLLDYSISNSSTSSAPPILNRAETLSIPQGSTPPIQQPDTLNPNSSRAANAEVILKTFMPNVLDTYENITYNFALLMAPEDQLLNPTIEPTGPLYTVAETGVSSNFFITDVEIESIVSPNSLTRNISSNTFSIKIVEPQGIRLIDRIMAAAKNLGIRNINVCPMILELSFKGYTPNGIPTEATITRRTWKIQLQDISTTLNEGGSEYILSFIICQEYAFNRLSAASIIQQQLTFPIDTVGQFFDDLGYHLTLQSAKVAAQGQTSRSEYEFKIDPEMRSWKIGESADNKNSPSMFVDQNGKRSIVLNTDITLDKLVDMVIGATKEGNLMANPNSTPEKMDMAPNGSKVSQVVSVRGRVDFLGFNQKANDYIRKYTYYVNKFDSFRAIVDEPTIENSEERARYIIEDALKKNYQYMFTGQNTDVLNLDLNLNALWAHSSLYYASSLQRKNNTNSKFIQRQNDVLSQDDLRQKVTASAFLPNVPSQSETSTSNQYGPFLPQNNLNSNLNLPMDQNSADLQALDRSSNSTAQNNLRDQLMAQDQRDGVVPVEGADSIELSNNPVIVGTGSRLRPGLSGILIETLEDNPMLNSSESENKDPVQEMYRKELDPSINSSRITNNLEETTDLGRSIFGVITNQLYNTSEFTNLMTVSLEIRGDPYWLGETDIEMLERLDSNSVRDTQNQEYANYLRGEHCFLLSFNTPQTYGEDTGFVQVGSSDLFVGIYSVNKVIHTFSNGKFIQTLEAIRDIQTSASEIRKFIR